VGHRAGRSLPGRHRSGGGLLGAEVVAQGTSKVQRTKDRVRGSGGVALVLFAAVIALVLACRKWDNPLDPTGNHPPAVPKYPSPADSSIRTNVGLVLSWHSYDPDSGDTAYFDVFMGTASPPGLLQAGWTDTTFQPTNLACSTEYHWRVIAYDNHGDSTVGPLWQFQTVAPLTVTAPDTGERLRMYTTDTIAWTGGQPIVDSTVLYRSVDDGASWNRLGRATSPGQFVWQVPGPMTDSARVKVVAYASTDTMTGTSSRFAIEDTLSSSGMDVTSPDSGSVWTRGSARNAISSARTRGADSDDDGLIPIPGGSLKGSR